MRHIAFSFISRYFLEHKTTCHEVADIIIVGRAELEKNRENLQKPIDK